MSVYVRFVMRGVCVCVATECKQQVKVEHDTAQEQRAMKKKEKFFKFYNNNKCHMKLIGMTITAKHWE